LSSAARVVRGVVTCTAGRRAALGMCDSGHTCPSPSAPRRPAARR
jgi:hypothetical protein